MLTEVKNNIRFLILSLKYNLKACAEYKKSFIVQIIFMIVNNGFFLIFWSVVFGVNNGNINNLTMKDILYLWALCPGAWGIWEFLFGGVNQLNRYMLDGTLDTYLLQPKNLVMSIAMSKNDFGACGDLLYGLVIGIIASNSIKEFLLMLFFMILGAIIFFATTLFINTLSLYIGDTDQIAHVYTESLLLTFCTYPYQIFGTVIKTLMFTIVPAYYMVHLPIDILKNFDLKGILIVIAMTTMYISISLIFFYKSLKRYESGNNISMKE